MLDIGRQARGDLDRDAVPAVQVSQFDKDAALTRDDGNTTGLLTGGPGGGVEGEIGLSASNVQGAGDAGAIGVVGVPSINTVYLASVQGTILEKHEGRMTEVWIARSA
uniref:Uncharacterized protein n=1 Tax=Peronospora matthiolae TaxID=2874970 RepID=A0AAV1VN74_9STRA